jgi:predicted MFS family arabinose efflux permease
VREEIRVAREASFWGDLVAGLRFVARTRLLVTLAVLMAIWQMAHYAALVVQILVATRTLGLSEETVGLCYMGMGVGTITGSVWGRRISHRIGPGPCLVLGYAITGVGWLLPALAPANAWGVAAFAAMMAMFTMGAVFIFINFLALRQAATPEPLLGRMTSTMRWLSLLVAPAGSLLGGWLGEHVGLRSALAFAAGVSLLLAVAAWQLPIIRNLRALPKPEHVPGLDEAESEWTALG